MLRRILALAIKELTSLWSDRKMRFVLLIPPLIQVFLFANAANYEVTHVPLGIWMEDNGAPAEQLAEDFAGSVAFSPGPPILGPQDAAAAIEDRRTVAVLHIPQRFSADVLAGRSAHVQLLMDARRSNSALMVSQYAAEIVAQYSVALRGRAAAPVTVETRDLFNPTLESTWFILPGLVVILSFMMTTLVSALSLAPERELGTLEQMLVTPLRPLEIMLGKAVPALIVGLIEANIVLAAGVLGYGLPLAGNPAVLEACLVLFDLAALGLGLAISAVTWTQQQAMLGVFTFASPAIAISGFATPEENMPRAMQVLSWIDPLRYMLVISRGEFLQNLPLEVVLRQSWPMALIALATLTVAVRMVRRAVG